MRTKPPNQLSCSCIYTLKTYAADCVGTSFYLREENAWKSLARLTSEYPLAAKAFSGTSFSFRYTSFCIFIWFTSTGKKIIIKKHKENQKNIKIWYFGLISNTSKVMKPSLEEEQCSQLCFSPNKPLKCNHNRSNAVKSVMISLRGAERTIT